MHSLPSGTILRVLVLFVCACNLPILAQEPAADVAPAVQSARVSEGAVPRLIRFSGVLHQRNDGQAPGKHLVGLTFALYEEQEGGEPLWQEAQNVRLDDQGRYTVFLGATGDLPIDAFASARAHWLGIRVEGGEELPRALLVSVPYALKAADAETLGGRPASAYLLAKSQGETTDSTTSGSKTAQAPGPLSPAIGPINGEGTPNQLAKYTADAFTIGDSMLSDDGAGLLQFAAPIPEFRITNTSPTTIPPQLSFYDGATLGGFLQYRTSTTAVPNMLALGGKASGSQFAIYADDRERVRIDAAGQMGIGTTTPESLLHLEAPNSELRLRSTALNGIPQISFYEGPTLGGFMQYRNSGAANPNLFMLGGKAPGSEVAIFTHGAERLRIDANGNVGIGTSTPGRKLSVAGMIESTAGGFKFPDGTVQTTKGEGAVTSITAGLGLIATPSPITGAGTLSINTSIVPRLHFPNTFTFLQTFVEGVQVGSGSSPKTLQVFAGDVGAKNLKFQDCFSGDCGQAGGIGLNPPPVAFPGAPALFFYTNGGALSFQVFDTAHMEALRLNANPWPTPNEVTVGMDGFPALLHVKGPVRTTDDIHTETEGKGLVVKSPDGTRCARIGINNSGALAVTAVTCPP